LNEIVEDECTLSRKTKDIRERKWIEMRSDLPVAVVNECK
jgi:hypothetical protein